MPDGTQHPRLLHHFENLDGQKSASTLGMWVFMANEIMMFGGLFLVYLVYRTQYGEAFRLGSHELDIKLGAINTAVLIGSSLTMALAVYSAQKGARKHIVLWLLMTVLLGAVFLGIKLVEYAAKFDHHLLPGPHFSFPGPHAPPVEIFYSLYFAMTGLHASHMLIGIPLILFYAWQAHRGRFDASYNTPIELIGLYWHFVDIVWIYLFPLLYLIGRS